MNLYSALTYVFVSLAGLCVVVAAPYLGGGVKEYSSFLPWIRAGVEGQSWWTVGGLAFVGFFAGYLRRQVPWLLGFSTVALLPLWATIEMGLDPTSHNLWPLEFGIYAFWGLMASAGAHAGVRLRRNR